jgi:hypothetical protein
MFSNFFPPKNHAVYEIMSKNMVELERLQMPIWRMRDACWISKVTRPHRCSHTHTHARRYLMLTAFPLQESFRERASILRYMYIAFCYIPPSCSFILILHISLSPFGFFFPPDFPLIFLLLCLCVYILHLLQTMEKTEHSFCPIPLAHYCSEMRFDWLRELV